uniref:Diaminopimelic acid decarboxylase chloroplastic-like protein 062 n=1 Tax=Saccoglossus kowalevskii TaxID=10224 RepID=A0A1L7H7E8_SACKO|nr:diaminopimelic acid decarboxylase chloroplastic-like protein 062 [Saccoglossus kowalevskii]
MAVELLKVDYRTALSSKPNISTSSNIYMTGDGHLFCENLCVKEIQYELAMKTDYASPFYLYSRAQIVDNVQQYKRSLEKNDVPHLLGYTVSANYNLEILRILQKLGCSAVVASINEIKIAMMAGFNPNMMVYNGNGKQLNELEFAVKCGVMINVDSLFDLEHIRKVCRMLHKKANVLMRLHPEIDSDSSQDITETKFGLHHKEFDKALQIVKEEELVDLIGLHCHLETTLDDVQLFKESLDTMLFWVDKVREMGFDIRYLNMGEGIGLNYKRHIPQSDEILPETKDFISSIAEGIKSKNICLILEPGISIVGNTGILVTKVVGVKTNENKNFIVIDGSMAEVIRPSLYGAYHHIQLIEPTMCKKEGCVFDIVGPIGESSDFLAEDYYMPYPHEGCGLAIRDVGAYCGSMSSNYSLRQRPAEVLVEGSRWRIIRHAEVFDDIVKPFIGLPSLGVYKDYIDTTEVHLGTLHPWLTWMH